MLVVALVGAQPASLATFTVINTNDSGDGSLRQAILDANGAAGADTITFGIPGAGPHTIQPLTQLPGITGPTVLDGTTQSGFAGTPIIELDGSLAGESDGLFINASGPVTVRGLVVNRFGREGIQIQGTGAVTLEGNYIGTNVAGTAALPNGRRGVLFNSSSGHTIGGTAAGAGNLISGNSNIGIGIFSSSNNTIQGNRIGTNAAGTAALPNGPGGIQLFGGNPPFGVTGNTIGGTATGAGNLISGNTGPGILFNSSGTAPSVAGNTIQGNLIGTDVTGDSALGNSGINGRGISIVNVGGIADNTIGGTGADEANTIAFNAGDGVSISSDPGNVRNEIRGNEIHSNGGLGIDLGPDGVTPNDALDADSGANNLQNFPVLNPDQSSATAVSGNLESVPDQTYDIDVYASPSCDASGNGEGETHVASFQVTTNGSGQATFTDQPLVPSSSGFLTATATDATGNTSEFSSCLDVGGGGGEGDTYIVNSNGDPGDGVCDGESCTLREAINAANDDGGDSTILFDLGTGTQIALTDALPPITDTVLIDGTSQPEGTVVINGDGAGFTDGVVLDDGADGSTIEGLEIRDFFDGAAIRVGSGGNSIAGNLLHAVNSGIVVSSLDASNNLIGGSAAANEANQIWDYVIDGVAVLDAGTGNEVAGNVIGLDGELLSAGEHGVRVSNSNGTIVGYDVGPDRLDLIDAGRDRANVIVGTDGATSGITVASSGTIVAGNRVGTDRTGTADLGNFGAGISVVSENNQIGPGNTVAYNDGDGVLVQGAEGNRIVANSIFQNSGLGIELQEGNGELPAPTIFTAVASDAGTADVSGEFSGPPGTYFVEFFENTTCDDSGAGEGETYVGFAQVVVSDDVGNHAFAGETFPGVAVGDVLTATLTHGDANNTSEFSECTIVEEGGGEAGTPPVLFAAVPDATPGTLGVAGLIDTGDPEPGQLFDVAFYSVPECDPSAPKTPLGTGDDFATNENGIAAFAKDGLTNVSVGTLVTATATPSGGSASAISNCVVADRNNTTWPTALQLTATDTEPGHLRELGEARWFKVPILPASRVHISLTNLPADYDLVVFSDIQEAYDRLVGGEQYDPEQGPNLALDDLNRAGAETPTDVFNTSQYNPSSWDATNWEPDLNTSVFSPSQWSPSQWSPSQWSATQWSPSQWSPSQWSPSQWSPSQWSPSQWSPSQWSPSQWSPSQWSSSNPADPAAFTTAQTASLLAISGGTGTGDERVSVNTWNNTGFMYIRVQGKNGSFDAEQPFTLEVAREGNLCSGVADQPSSPTAPAGDRRTLILVDSSRMTIPGSLSTKLATFAARPEVEGEIVQVNADSTVSALNAQADSKPSCPFAKNLVAAAIKRIVDAYRAVNPIEHVVVVGGDSTIPFYRYPDPALLGNETMYVPPVRDDTASQASLRLGYVLNQDGYVATESISLHGNLFPVPDLAIGRLVETPAEIEGMLDAYLATSVGVVPTPTSALVTGYDFLTDTADTIADHFEAGIGGAATEELITDQTISPGVVSDGADNAEGYYRTRSWTGTDLRRELVNSSRDLVFLAGHFSANDALAADYKTNVLSTELESSSANFENAIVFSAGCHAGYNIVNSDATQWTEPLDWAQAFARKKATLISGTGYQYGDTDFLAHSERIYAEFARQLRITSTAGVAEPVAVGSALLRAKQIFLETTPGLTALDEKSLLQTTLFGLPMLSVNLPLGRIVEGPEGSVVPGRTAFESGPGAELGLEFADLPVGPGLTSRQKQLKLTDGTNGPLATWLEGPDGVAVRPTQPIIPLESLNVTVADTALRGVAFRGGSYTDTPDVTPLTAAPATELRGVHAPFFTDVFFPTQPWTTNYFGALAGGSGVTRLHATPVQHRTSSPATRRAFGSVNLRLFYSDNVSSYCAGTDPLMLAPCPGDIAIAPALAAPPTITGVATSYDESTDELTFEARALGHLVAGIQSVWVTWTVPPGASGGSGSWQSLDLERDEDDPTLWTATLGGITNASAVHFIVQAVNGVGRVTIDDNVGAFYRHGSIPGPLPEGAPEPAATTMTFVTPPPSSIPFGQSFTVKVRLTQGGAGGSPLGGKLVRAGIGSPGIPATTNASGEAEFALRAALTPGTYPVISSFSGDTTHAASSASDEIEVVRRPTTMTLAGTLGPAIPLVATLRASGTPAVPLHQRTVFVVVQGPVTEVFRGITDPQGRVTLSEAFLAELPSGDYTASAHFNGVTLPGGVVIPPDDLDYGPSSANLSIELWPFTGFIGLSNPPTFNSARAGTSIPIKFSLGANRGLDIFASGYPKVGTINCATGVAIDGLTLAENTGFRYDTKNRHYTYDWRTQRGWTGCRQLVLRFADGTERVLWFRF